MKRIFVSLATVAGLTLAAPADAAFVVDILQSGSDVYATGFGSVNTGGLAFLGTGQPGASLFSPVANIGFGSDLLNAYSGVSGPSSFGGNFGLLPSYPTISTGSSITLAGRNGQLYLPQNYISGNFLFSTDLFTNTNFATLGLNPGQYVYSSGTGANADTFTVNVGPIAAVVPEPSTWAMMLIGFGAIGFALRRNTRKNLLIQTA